MTDEELIERLLGGCSCNIDTSPCMAEDDCRLDMEAARRITALTEQLEAARRDAKEAEAYAAELESSAKWQPIETAPRDGTRVLAYWPDCYGNNAACQVESWFGPWGNGDAKMTWQSAFEWADGHNNPTHWMPLPEPPQ